jgi:hypothetical protein
MSLLTSSIKILINGTTLSGALPNLPIIWGPMDLVELSVYESITTMCFGRRAMQIYPRLSSKTAIRVEYMEVFWSCSSLLRVQSF